MSLVLVVDDKEMLRDSVGQTLSRHGLEVQTADSASAALELIAARRPDCVVTDLKMPGMTGIELLERIKQIDEDLPVILMTAFATVETAVKAMKLGAYDYIPKPPEGDALIIAVKRAIENGRLLRENAVLRITGGIPASVPSGVTPTAAPGTPGFAAPGTGLARLIGDSPAMRRVKEQVLAVAESTGTVMIIGESGTGKEVVARAVHELSSRYQTGPFLGVNCAALSENLLESELFGHERGAFTGADKTRKGRFELADRGTLLLDEISEVSTRIQAKLLRVLQEKVIERVGSSLSIGVDVRTIATSNRDLPRAIARNEFRQDLFFRINVLPIHLPPLRDRLEDVPALAEHFISTIARRDGRRVPELSAAARDVLMGYHWPGNVRELQNICERAVALCRTDAIAGELLEPWLLLGSIAPAGETLLGSPSGQHAAGHAQELAANIYNGTQLGSNTPAHAGPTGAGHVGGHIHEYKSMPARSALANPLAHSLAEPRIPDAARVAIDGRLLEDIERDAIVTILQRFNGHRQKTAQALGIGVRTLGLKLKKWKELQLIDEAL
ncbi:MAG: sigma-54-dependent transcriptional regulator [Phycisphaerales bacterium]|jgi:DNA-binding NtrC family response regulator|nr:sigma-54 dependent transcriptional regulator [Phycisphaeraceae bacterium]